MPPKKKTFAKSIERLEAIIDEMENVDTPLEEALKLYKEGVELVTDCQKSLNSAEKEIVLLQQNSDGIFSEKPFNLEG